MPNIQVDYFSGLHSNGLSNNHQETEDVCIPNISPFERKIRLKFAIRQFVVTLLVLGVMTALHLHPLWRLLLFFLFSASTVSYFQSPGKT